MRFVRVLFLVGPLLVCQQAFSDHGFPDKQLQKTQGLQPDPVISIKIGPPPINVWKVGAALRRLDHTLQIAEARLQKAQDRIHLSESHRLSLSNRLAFEDSANSTASISKMLVNLIAEKHDLVMHLEMLVKSHDIHRQSRDSLDAIHQKLLLDSLKR